MPGRDPAVPELLNSVIALRACCWAQGERPRASLGHAARCCAQATNGLVLDLRHAVAQLWASSADAIRAACGPHVPAGLVDEIDLPG